MNPAPIKVKKKLQTLRISKSHHPTTRTYIEYFHLVKPPEGVLAGPQPESLRTPAAPPRSRHLSLHTQKPAKRGSDNALLISPRTMLRSKLLQTVIVVVWTVGLFFLTASLFDPPMRDLAGLEAAERELEERRDPCRGRDNVIGVLDGGWLGNQGKK